MKRIISLAVARASFSATTFPADRHIAFERDNAIYVANLDGTNEKKIGTGRCQHAGRSISFRKTRLD
jgi:hypothetical protein